MQLIDSHCHLDFKVFDKDRDELILSALKHHVKHIIVPSVKRDNWQRVLEVKNKHKMMEVAYGLHPMFLKQHQPGDIALLRDFIEKNRPIAVGECGLDFFIPEANNDHQREQQTFYFSEQLKMADEYTLPIIIHARKSLDIVLKYIRQYPNVRGVIHSFSGSKQQAEHCIKQGFLLGFGGPITYTRASRLRKLVSELPLECLLLETDAPDQPDSKHYGQRNVPSNLVDIARVVAELRSCDVIEVAKVTTQNAKDLFQLEL